MKTETSFKPSKYQKKIFEFVAAGQGNAIVQAVAGSGKTRTIVEAAKLLPNNQRAVFCAFNKNIATELATRLPRNMEARTLHSIGNAMFKSNVSGRVEVNNYKIADIIVSILSKEGIRPEDEKFKAISFPVKKMVSFIKADMVDYKNYADVLACAEAHNIEDVDETTFNYIRDVMELSNADQHNIDFDDMIYMPVKFKFKTMTYDWVFVDEVQDLNKSQLDLVKMICNGNTRILAVGDRQQSIYAFRGADTNSMDNFKAYFKAKEFPLSICYRCSKKVVELAKTIVPQIESAPTAVEGTVQNVKQDVLFAKAKDGDMVLSRTNAPLVKVAFAFIREGKKAIIRGRDIGQNLITLVSKYKAADVNQLMEKINKFRALNMDKLQLIESGKMNRNKKGAIMQQIDSCDTILCVCDQLETDATVRDLQNKIEGIFSDDNAGIVCSSVHKAKGLEAENVFIVNYANMPHPLAKTEEEYQQEMNLKYVAITRAKVNLFLIDKIKEEM